MRRLATQKRGDSVQSNRDYQHILELGEPVSFVPRKSGTDTVLCLDYSEETEEQTVAGFGGYIASTNDLNVLISLSGHNEDSLFKKNVSIEGQRHWTRVGFVWIQNNPTSGWRVEFRWDGEGELIVWGLNVASLELPDKVTKFIQNSTEGLSYMSKRHLAPEAFYLPHETALDGAKITKRTNLTKTQSTRNNPGQKCSQCQRHLPIDPRLDQYRSESDGVTRSPQSMILAFHGHRSKKTGYQNECRACKKFEINEYFNIRRTSDQLLAPVIAVPYSVHEDQSQQ